MRKQLQNTIALTTISAMLLGLTSCASDSIATDTVGTSNTSVTKVTAATETQSTTVSITDSATSTDEQESETWGINNDSEAAFSCELMRCLYEEDSNMCISPVNLYIILGTLTEITAGESYEQVCALLQTNDLEQIREEVVNLMNSTYGSTSFANSLWMDSNYTYNAAVLDALEEFYQSDFYSETLGTAEVNAKLHEWINTKTNNLLEEAAEQFNTEPNTVFAMVSAIALESNWKNAFAAESTYEGTFTTADGSITDVQFMSDESEEYKYYRAFSFSATYKELDDGNLMWFILPSEGLTISEVMNSDEFKQFMSEPEGFRSATDYKIILSIPKFDVSSKYELPDYLNSLGISAIFNPDTADFTPITEVPHLFVDQFIHASRIMIDEEGVTAAAFSGYSTKNLALDPNDIYMRFDRPFLYMVTGSGNSALPLFAGIVSNPQS